MAVTDEAIEKIKAMITSGALRAGDRLPREADLAARARVWRGLTQIGARARTLAEHRAILDALAARDPEVARSWATVHIAGVEQWLASVP